MILIDCINNNICTDCYNEISDRNQNCPFCRSELVSNSELLTKRRLNEILNNILPQTLIPGKVIQFQNDFNRIIQVIWCEHKLDQDRLGININSNLNGQCYVHLNTSGIRTVPVISTISISSRKNKKNI